VFVENDGEQDELHDPTGPSFGSHVNSGS